MKRLCVFAHWDRDNIIDDYVIYYLKALKEFCSTIIFVSDTDGVDVSKLSGIVDYSIVQKHGEYDFGSYKRGFFYALEKNIEFDELLFVNDSCFGPLFPLKPVFEKMSSKKCDFWGLSQNRYGVHDGNYLSNHPVQPHVQSYFMLFKRQVFESLAFKNFISDIKHLDSKNEIITQYEIGLSQMLYKNGFHSAVYINKYPFRLNPMVSKWDVLIQKYKFPLLKTSIVKNGFAITGEVKNWKEVIEKNTDYPLDLITKNYERLKDLEAELYSGFNIYRKIRFHLLKDVPPFVRFLVIQAEKKLYFVLNTICFNKLKKF